MIITAKFASVCPCCNSRIVPGNKVEWTKGSPARHTACGSAPAAALSSGSSRPRSRNWDSSAFAGYGRPRGAYRKACVSGGNCSSIGSGRSCGGHDCDGF
jgi:hypothetical protein